MSTTHDVTNTATLSTAMAASVAGDTISMAAGTYAPDALTPSPAGYGAFALTIKAAALPGLGDVICDGGVATTGNNVAASYSIGAVPGQGFVLNVLDTVLGPKVLTFTGGILTVVA